MPAKTASAPKPVRSTPPAKGKTSKPFAAYGVPDSERGKGAKGKGGSGKKGC